MNPLISKTTGQKQAQTERKKSESRSRSRSRTQHKKRRRSYSRSRSRRRRRSSSRSSSRHHHSSSKHEKPKEYKRIKLFEIYDGRIASKLQNGYFVQLLNVENRAEGLLLNKETQRKDLSKGDSVKVKILGIVGKNITLSMNDVDQKTGENLNPERRNKNSDDGSGKSFSISDRKQKQIKRQLTDTELFELKQLVASGSLPRTMLPEYDEDLGGLNLDNAYELEIDFDVEINDKDPKFLKGQTSKANELSPIRIVKNPDGTLQRAATTQASLAKERKILREQQKARREGKDDRVKYQSN